MANAERTHMSDTDEATDLETARNAMLRESWYTAGWRGYLRGRPEPLNGYAAAGWRDAKHAREACDRNIMWSMDCTFPKMDSL
jgi:hypothetical protein